MKEIKSENPVRDEYAHLIAELTTDYIYRMKILGNGELEVAYVSSKFVQVIGYTAEEIETVEAWKRIVYPEDIHLLEKFFLKIMSGKQADLKYRLITKKGEIRWVHNYSQPISEDDSDRIIGVIGAARDITDTMRVQEAYQVLVNNSLQGLAIIQDLQIIFVNDVIAKISGYSKGELLQFDAQKIQEVIHPDDQERILRRLAGLSAGQEESRREEYRLFKKDGTECWVETYASPIQYREKRAVQIAFNDITEQKHAEIKLSEAKSNLERMLSSSPAIIYNLHLIADIPTIYISSNVTNELGYKPGEFYADHGFWRERVHPEDLQRMPLDPSKMVEAKESFEYRFKHADGTYRWVQDKRRVIKTPHNEPDEIVGYLIDITERKNMEDKIRRISSRLETILQNMPAGVLVEDENGNIILSNDSFCDMFGIADGPESLYGVHCLTAAKGAQEYFQDEKKFIDEIQELIQLKELKTQQELRLKDGRVFERDYIPIRENDEYRGHLWQYKDITERKKSESHLQRKSNFEQLISRLSTGFINLDVEHVDVAIYKTLQQIVEFLDADRGYVFQKEPESPILRLTHDWCKKGVPSLLGDMGEIDFTQMKYGYEKLLQFEPLIITQDFDLSLLSTPEKLLLEKYQMKSLVLIPMVAGGEVRGILGLDSSRESLRTTTQTISLLRLAADMLQNTIERKNFIQRIRKSEAISRAVLSSLAAHISVLDKDGTINAINNSWRQYARENGDPDLSNTGIGVNYFDVIENVEDGPDKKYADQVGAGIRSVLNREAKHFTLEYPMNLEDSVKWYLLSATPLTDASGGAVISHLDVTERKMAEETLRESEEKFRTLAENLPDTIHIFDLQKNEVVYTNRTEFLGYTPEQLGNNDFLKKVVHQDDWEVLKTGIQNIAQNKIPPDIEFRIKSANGQWEWVQKKISPFTSKNGKVTQILGVDTIISERKWSEEIIRESEEKFRNIVEQSSDAIVLTDKVGDIIQWNSAAEKIFDLSREEVLGKPIWDVQYAVAPSEQKTDENYGILRKMIVQFFEDQNAEWMGRIAENPIQRKDGTIRTVQTTMFPIYLDDGVMAGSIVRDVTESKQAQELLEQSEARYRGLLESQNDLIVRVDPEGNFTYVNDAYCQKFGKTREELLNGSFIPLVHPDDVDKTLAQMKKVEEPPYRVRIEQRAMTVDGWRWILWEDYAIKDHEGVTREVQGVGRDITDLKMAEAELREREQELSLITESTIDTIFMLDEQGIILYMSPSVVDLQGYTPEEMVGHNFAEFVPEQEMPKYMQGMREVFENKSIVNLEVDTRHKNGALIPSEINGRISLRNGNPVGIGSIRDITERKKAETELENLVGELAQSNRKLKVSNEELEHFTYVASHDLQEPLRKITAFGSLLTQSLGGRLDSDEEENFNFMIDGADRMQMLIEDLLQYSRLTTRAKPPGRVNITEVLENLVEVDLSVLIEENQASVEFDDSFSNVRADKIQIHQLFQNLITNAIKYARDDVKPLVIVSEEKSNVAGMKRFEVRDNGKGIDPEFHEAIFEMFRRLHNKSKHSGTGVGLAICKKIVTRYGGEIGVSSELGKGATFWFTLPEYTQNDDVVDDRRLDDMIQNL